MALVELHYHDQGGQPGPSFVVNADDIETIARAEGYARIKLLRQQTYISTHETYEQVLKATGPKRIL
jgi:hypothetical protein